MEFDGDGHRGVALHDGIDFGLVGGAVDHDSPCAARYAYFQQVAGLNPLYKRLEPVIIKKLLHNQNKALISEVAMGV